MLMKLGIIMDPIAGINIKKDSSFAMLLAAQAMGWELHYMEMHDLYAADGAVHARMWRLEVRDHPEHWYTLISNATQKLSMLDVILMRKDPPVTMDYIYITQLLELARHEGVLVVNNPAALRNYNEKLFINHFPDLTAPTLISRESGQLFAFIETHRDVILKPLDGMGGASIFRVNPADPNLPIIIESLTDLGRRLIVAQRYIPEIKDGDKRILLIDGTPVPYALARIPRPGEIRGNLAAGGTGKGVELSARDREICNRLAPVFREQGLLFVGIDVIGNYLTEINITSPTCIRELDAIYNLNIARDLMLAIEQKRRT